MSKAKTLTPVSSKSKPIDLTYRITYRNSRPKNMNYTFTKDFEYHGALEQILMQVKYEMGHYGGLKAEAIAGDLHEITN